MKTPCQLNPVETHILVFDFVEPVPHVCLIEREREKEKEKQRRRRTNKEGEGEKMQKEKEKEKKPPGYFSRFFIITYNIFEISNSDP
jgi:hypothetical protein